MVTVRKDFGLRRHVVAVKAQTCLRTPRRSAILADGVFLQALTIFPTPTGVQQKFGAKIGRFFLELLTGGGQGRITEP
jgi:hypothetical protein